MTRNKPIQNATEVIEMIYFALDASAITCNLQKLISRKGYFKFKSKKFLSPQTIKDKKQYL
jgi:hypothetical protein